MTYNQGDVIETPKFGPVRVVGPARTGLTVQLVDLFDQLLNLSWAELGVPEPAKRVSPPPPPAPAPPKVREENGVVADRYLADLRSRKAIEALRFGLVPTQSLEDLTLGYDELKHWVLEQLPEAHGFCPRLAEVVGHFGAGKSHTMSVVRHLAEERGYVTARVEVDGKTISLSDPARLLYSLWSTLTAQWGKFRHSATPLFDLYLEAIDQANPPPRLGNPYGKAGITDQIYDNYHTIAVLRILDRTEEFQDAIDAVLSSSPEWTVSEVLAKLRRSLPARAKDMRLKAMINNQTKHRPRDFVLTLAGHAHIARLAGYKGLIVTIDEVEVEQRFLTPVKRNEIRDLLQMVGAYLSDNAGIDPAPLGLFLATVEDHTDPLVQALIESTDADRYALHPWSTSDLRELAARIHRLYCAAYGIGADLDPAMVDLVEAQLSDEGYSETGQIRGFVKLLIGKLDSRFGPPALSL